MSIFKLFLTFVLLTVSATSYASNSPFKPVQDLFSAMSAVDHKKMKSVVTTDFQLLEDGEDWSIDDLINVVNPSKFKRRNYFSVIKIQISGQIAWVSYWNKATFTHGNNVESVAWLESAVMIREDGSWKTQMLHSTRIKAENIPKGIELIEYLD